MSENVLQRKGAWLRTIKAVAWSFVGLRKGSELQEDANKVNPVHLIVVAMGAVIVLVASLVFFVQWVVVAVK